MSDDKLRKPRETPDELERQATLKAEFDRVIADPDVARIWEVCKAAVGIGDPESLAYNIQALAAVFETHSPLFRQWYSCDDIGKLLLRKSLLQWAIRDVARDLARFEGVPQGEVDSYFAEELPTLGTRRLTPENSWVKGPCGLLVGPADAPTEQFLKAKDHRKLMRPEGKPGRTPGRRNRVPGVRRTLDESLARKAAAAADAGKKPLEIAQELGLKDADSYHPKLRNAARQRALRLIQRGRILKAGDSS